MKKKKKKRDEIDVPRYPYRGLFRDRSLFSGGGGGGGGRYFLNSNLGRATFFQFGFRGGL